MKGNIRQLGFHPPNKLTAILNPLPSLEFGVCCTHSLGFQQTSHGGLANGGFGSFRKILSMGAGEGAKRLVVGNGGTGDILRDLVHPGRAEWV